VITERELDAHLADAAGVRDEALPALPPTFLDVLRSEAPGAAGPEPAEGSSPRRRWRHRRRPLAVLVAAAAAAAALVVGLAPDATVPTPGGRTATPPGPGAMPTSGQPGSPAPGGLQPPPGGLALVATRQLTFPYSLDPVPAGLTPLLSRSGGVSPSGTGPVIWSAAYRSADVPGFGFSVSSEDPREMPGVEHPQDGYARYDITQRVTVTVDGTTADLVRGDYDEPSCQYAPSSPAQADEPAKVCARSFADLFWQRPDGQWVHVRGEDRYSDADAVVAVAGSIVDRPQPVPLQVGLAPAGWSVAGYEDDRALTLASDSEPSISQRLSISLLERWRGYTEPGDVLQGMTDGNPVDRVTVHGRPAELVSVPDGFAGPGDPHRTWNLAGQFADGTQFLFQAPDTLTRDQVLAVADEISYAR
jgi:hypothetical protein